MTEQNTTPAAILNEDGSFGEGFAKLVGDEYAGHAEIKNAGNLQTFVKNHFNLVKKLGEKTEGMVKIPGEKATEDEVKAYRTAIGVPDNADGYQFEKPQLPEGMSFDEGLEKGFKAMALELNLNAKQAAGLYKMYNDYQMGLHQSVMDADTQNTTTAQEALKKEWGGKYQDNVNLSLKAMNTFADPEFKKYLDETRLGNHPAMIKMMHNIASKISEDNFISGDHENKGGDGDLTEIYPSMK